MSDCIIKRSSPGKVSTDDHVENRSQSVPLLRGPSESALNSSPKRHTSAMIGPIFQSIWGDSSLAMSILLSLCIIFIVSYTRSPWRKLPPGPQRLPIIGNTLQLMDKNFLLSKRFKEDFSKSLARSFWWDAKTRWIYGKYQERSRVSTLLDSPSSF